MNDKKARPAPWSDHENAAAVRLYFDMIACVTAACKYNKAAMVRSYQFTDEGRHAEALSIRSRPSIEMKLMNCSAIHKEQGAEITMDDHGYRAMPNYQTALKVAMIAEMDDRQLTADIATSQANEQRAGA
jgi:hypothetical protein